jgi:hypothetical protein
MENSKDNNIVNEVLKKEILYTNKSAGRKIWDAINELIKSPVFVFFFGASIATIYPVIKNFITPDIILEEQRRAERIKADAQLIAPFLANLSEKEQGKFMASKAALFTLQKTLKTERDGESPLFLAVNSAIETIAQQIAPRSTNDTVTSETRTRQLENIARSVEESVVDIPTAYQSLKNTIIYIQVEKDNPGKLSIAEQIRKSLRDSSVIAPPIEKLDTKRIPAKTQVRYFKNSDYNNAVNLTAIIKNIYKNNVYLVKLESKADNCPLEIWMGRE